MKGFYEKIKSSRGASMIFALLVFLLCVLVGTVALSAASSNVGRYTHMETEQQQYFSVASALELLQSKLDEKLEADPVSVTVKCVETEEWHYEPASTEGQYELKTETNTVITLVDPDLLPGENVSYYQYQLLENCLPAEWWTQLKDDLSLTVAPTWTDMEYTIQLDTGSGDTPSWADSLYPVHVKVDDPADAGTGDVQKYTLEMHLSTEKGNAYPLKVVWPGEAMTEKQTTTETTGDVMPPDPTNPTSPDSKGTRTTTTTLTCKLRWSAEDRVVTFE